MPHFTLSSPRYSVREPSSRSRDTLPYEEEDEDDNEGEAETPQADGDGDHCGLSEDGDNSSDGDSEMVDANDAEDEDEYAQFSTDLEKYQYDQKNFARPTTKKGPKSKSKALPKKIAAPRKVALPKKGKSKQTSRANALQSPPLKLGIDFNPTGDMWYTHHIRGSNGKRVWLSQRAVYHHWIRAELSRYENSKGAYVFPRLRGPGNWDITCFSEIQRDSGLTRDHYPPIMFEYERLDRADPAYALGNLYHGVQLVIDYWEKPIRNFEEIPLVISPKFEGGFMEPALRTHSEMALRDIRARMPAFVEMALRLNGKKVGTALRPLYAANTLSGRARRFREKAGAIGWEKNASTAIKEFMDQVVKPINNSTLDREDLTPQQLAQLRALTADTHSERRKTTTTEAASAAYMADTLRRARLAGANRLRRTVIDFEPYQASSPRNFHLVQSSCPSEPKPSVLSMTAEEASTRNDVDLSDGKHSIPTTPAELNAIHRALQLTVDHFYGVIGHLPTLPGTGTYISQYVDIQRQFGDSWLGGQPTPPPFSVEANGVGVLGTGRTVLSFAVMDGEEGETLLDVAFASLVSWGYLDSSLA